MQPRFSCPASVIYLLFVSLSLSSARAAENATNFAPLDQWKTAILSGDQSALKSIYSTNPPAEINTTAGKVGADVEVAFWIGLKAKTLNIRVIESVLRRPDLQLVTFEAQVKTAGGRSTRVVEDQAWQNQGGTWLLAGAKRDIAKLAQPASLDAKIYPASANAHSEIYEAVSRASKAHKRVILIFGADWCYDCHVLDKALRRPDVAAVLKPNYEVVDVDIGEGNKNQDLMKQYEVPMNRGVPAIAVLDSDGRLLYSQKNGEWERARGLGPDDLIQFLNNWKPQAR